MAGQGGLVAQSMNLMSNSVPCARQKQEYRTVKKKMTSKRKMCRKARAAEHDKGGCTTGKRPGS